MCSKHWWSERTGWGGSLGLRCTVLKWLSRSPSPILTTQVADCEILRVFSNLQGGVQICTTRVIVMRSHVPPFYLSGACLSRIMPNSYTYAFLCLHIPSAVRNKEAASCLRGSLSLRDTKEKRKVAKDV